MEKRGKLRLLMPLLTLGGALGLMPLFAAPKLIHRTDALTE